MNCHGAVIGAGPYRLAVAAHLRNAGVEARVVGQPMAFWRQAMPRGMLLRSEWPGSHIADPRRALTLDCYEAARGTALAPPAAHRLRRPRPLVPAPGGAGPRSPARDQGRAVGHADRGMGAA